MFTYKKEDFTEPVKTDDLKVSDVFTDENDFFYEVENIDAVGAISVCRLRIRHLIDPSVDFTRDFSEDTLQQIACFLRGLKIRVSISFDESIPSKPKSIQALLDEALSREIHKVRKI